MFRKLLRLIADTLSDQASLQDERQSSAPEPLAPEWQPSIFVGRLESAIDEVCVEAAKAIEGHIFNLRFLMRWASFGAGGLLAYYGFYMAAWVAVTYTQPLVGPVAASFVGVVGYVLYAVLFGIVPASFKKWLGTRAAVGRSQSSHSWQFEFWIFVILQLVVIIGAVWLFEPTQTRELGVALTALTLILYGGALIGSGLLRFAYSRVSPTFITLFLGELFTTHTLGLTCEPARSEKLHEWLAARLGSRFPDAPKAAWAAVKVSSESRSVMQQNRLQPLLGIAAGLALLGVVSNQLSRLLGEITAFAAWSASPITGRANETETSQAALEIYLTLFIVVVVVMVTRVFMRAYAQLSVLSLIQHTADKNANNPSL